MCVANKNKILLNCSLQSKEENLLCPVFHLKIFGRIPHQVECFSMWCRYSQGLDCLMDFSGIAVILIPVHPLLVCKLWDAV